MSTAATHARTHAPRRGPGRAANTHGSMTADTALRCQPPPTHPTTPYPPPPAPSVTRERTLAAGVESVHDHTKNGAAPLLDRVAPTGYTLHASQPTTVAQPQPTMTAQPQPMTPSDSGRHEGGRGARGRGGVRVGSSAIGMGVVGRSAGWKCAGGKQCGWAAVRLGSRAGKAGGFPRATESSATHA